MTLGPIHHKAFDTLYLYTTSPLISRRSRSKLVKAEHQSRSAQKTQSRSLREHIEQSRVAKKNLLVQFYYKAFNTTLYLHTLAISPLIGHRSGSKLVKAECQSR